MKLDNKTLASYFAEFLGTFIFVTIIFFSVTVARGVEAFSIGLGLIVLIYAFNKYTKAHFNPLVTVGALIAKKINLQDALFYMFVQFAAVFMAFGVGVFVQNAYVDYQLQENADLAQGTADLTDQIKEAYALYPNYDEGTTTLAYILEGMLAYVFVLVAIMIMDNDKHKNAAGFVIGLTLFIIIAMASPMTGASFHPFRSLVTGLFNMSTISDGKETIDTLNYFGVYFFVPFGAAVLAGGTYWLPKLLEKPLKLSASVEKTADKSASKNSESKSKTKKTSKTKKK